MKKLFVILIALALLVGVSTTAFAAEAALIAYGGGVGLGTLRTVTCTNNTTSTTYTMLPVAQKEWVGYTEPGIIPGKVKILGYDVICTNSSGPTNFGTVSLIDAILWSLNSGDIFAEVEATPTIPVSKIYPAGMSLKYGLVIDQGPYTSVTVYYIQDQG